MTAPRARWLAASSAVFISVLILLFLPSEIYLHNPKEFVSTTPALVGNLVLGSLTLAAILVLPALVPRIGWLRIYAVALTGGFFALWFSGVFLVADLGEMDGASFDLSRHSGTLALHSAWFLLALAVACITAWKWPRQALQAAAVVGAGLAVIGALNFYRAGNQQDDIWEPASIRDVARFSGEKNLLILLMDSFQADVLQDIIDQDPGLLERLEGFRFYPDNLGVAPSTYLTMPAFHSGEMYNNMMSLPEYYDLGVIEGSFLGELASNGYQVDMINPILGVCPRGTRTCTVQENLLLHVDDINGSETARLADLGILRAMPGLLKQWVFHGSSGPVTRLRDDVALTGLDLRVFQGNATLELIADGLWTSEGPPTAKLLHLLNTHPPFMFDPDCNFIGVQKAIDRAHMTMQTACAMRWFTRFLDRLKDQGVYDNSMIILSSDTGLGNIWGDDDLSSAFAREHGVEPGEFGRLIGGANPVLAIKFPGHRGPARSSPAQAQLTDIPRTVCEALGDCANRLGVNLANDDTGDRERIYKYYRWSSKYWGLSHIPGIVDYRISGPLWLESSWSRALPTALPEAISGISFSHDDPPEVFGMGWGEVEVNQSGITKRWAIDRKAELYLRLPPGTGLTLEFEVLTAPGVDDQEMTVLVDGRQVGSRKLEHRVQFVSVTVPEHLVTGPVSRVDLEFSSLQEPETGGRRNVSVSFFNLKVYQAAEQPASPGG